MTGTSGLNPGFDPMDLFGPAMLRTNKKFDIDGWDVEPGQERKCYNRKTLKDNFHPPKWLPKSHVDAIKWFKLNLRAFQKIDETSRAVMLEWWRVIEEFPEGSRLEDIITKVHHNSQGLPLFDRFFGTHYEQFLKDPMFGYDFVTYIQWCDANHTTTKGRVFSAIVTHKFHIRLQNARVIAIRALYSITCDGNSTAEVVKFMAKVRFAFQHLVVGDIKDGEYAYHWLWERLRHYGGIKRFVEKIKRARDKPEYAYRRTWNYLWGVTHRHIQDSNIDANDENYVKSFIHNIQTGGMSGEIAKGKGKGSWDLYGDGKGKKGKGKGKNKGKGKKGGGSGPAWGDPSYGQAGQDDIDPLSGMPAKPKTKKKNKADANSQEAPALAALETKRREAQSAASKAKNAYDKGEMTWADGCHYSV